MKKFLNNPITRKNAVTYLMVTVFFLVMQVMNMGGMLSSSWKGFLVPICVYISLAVSLNLLVGICGELSLGHAGFMGIGAFTGIVVAAMLKDVISVNALRLLIAMAVGGMMAGLVYKFFERWNKVLAVFAAALVCPVVNTGVFLIGCCLFFLETVAEWGRGLGYENVAAYMFLGLAGANFLVELAVNLVLAPVIVRLIKIGNK